MGTIMGTAIKFVSVNALLCLLVLLFSCQQTKPEKVIAKNTASDKIIKTAQRDKAAQMRKFDIDNFEKQMIADPLYDGKTLEDGSYVQEYYIPKPNADTAPFNRNSAQLFVEKIRHKDGFEELVTYYSNGNIKEYNKFFSIELEVGIWKYYDEQGNVTKTINKDSDYKFTLNDVIAYGKKNEVDFHQDGDLQRGFSNRFKKNVWTISWIEDVPSKDSIEHFCILDGDSGAVLERQKRDAPIRKAG
ncbi:hypothetical protein ACTJKN_27200 [Pedobacter sp. 22163]|uniref:hypothetical protein n=1 Tax=Pedobacter sp. 22163 TaxID=3453883 RepID=UPI003F83E6A1